MANKSAIDDKELTPAPGAEGSSIEQPQGEQLTAETPEWVERLIASNEAVIKSNESLETLLAEVIEAGPAHEQSNQEVVNSIKNFGKMAVEFLQSGKTDALAPVQTDDFDEDAEYEVAPGKSFRDPHDFSKEYTEGDDVSHLPVVNLQRLFTQGLIEAI